MSDVSEFLHVFSLCCMIDRYFRFWKLDVRVQLLCVVILIRYGIPSVLLLEIDLLPLRTDGDISHFTFTPLISWDGHLTDDQRSNLW